MLKESFLINELYWCWLSVLFSTHKQIQYDFLHKLIYLWLTNTYIIDAY